MAWLKALIVRFQRVGRRVRQLWDQHPKEFASAAFGIIGALVATVMVQALLLRGIGWSFNLGSLPDWLAGIGTVGTLWVAGLVWRHDVRGRRADESAKRAMDKRAQAEQVAAWVVGQGPGEIVIGLINASKGLVYDAQIQTIAKPTSFKSAVTSPLMLSWARTTARGQVSVVPPGEGRVYLSFTVPQDMEVSSVALWFRDQSGVVWHRDTHGRLSERSGRDFALLDPVSDSISVKMMFRGTPYVVETQMLRFVRRSPDLPRSSS